jgi:hypothetical protein
VAVRSSGIDRRPDCRRDEVQGVGFQIEVWSPPRKCRIECGVRGFDLRSCLTDECDVIAWRDMKMNLLAVLFGLALVAVGCVSTVGENKTGGVPLVKDRVEAKYPRSVDQVFNAAKSVMAQKGTVTSESNLLGQTNAVRVLQGKVNQRSVWMRIEGAGANMSLLTVQVRTSGGGTDKALAHQLDKEVAVALAAQR